MKQQIKKLLTRETVSYLFFGVLTTIVNYGVYEICKWLSIHYTASTIIAWILAVAFAYLTNKWFVFESKSFKKAVLLREIPSFVGCRLFSGLCDLGFMVLAVEFLSIHDSIAKLLSNVFVVIINYIFSKLFIFRKSK
ncbi:MAG: GtrA family protein [Lachnospiraceae bacterium]|nr:GtrA family protein [Lachnospiraceae bacterium]